MNKFLLKYRPTQLLSTFRQKLKDEIGTIAVQKGQEEIVFRVQNGLLEQELVQNDVNEARGRLLQQSRVAFNKKIHDRIPTIMSDYLPVTTAAQLQRDLTFVDGLDNFGNREKALFKLSAATLSHDICRISLSRGHCRTTIFFF